MASKRDQEQGTRPPTKQGDGDPFRTSTDKRESPKQS